MKMNPSRRKFVKNTALASAAISLALPSLALLPPEQSWGIQLFTIPGMVSEDFEGSMRKLSGLGYKEVEFFGPYAFSDPETIASWKGIANQLGIKQNAFYGHDITEVRTLMAELGLATPSVHLDLLTLRNGLENAAENLAALNTRYVAIPTLPDTEKLTDIDAFKVFAEEFNELGRKLKQFDLQFVYHNHGYEHWSKGGRSPMEVLIDETDPNFVTFELDIFWMVAGGEDPVDWLRAHPGRFKLMHVKDGIGEVRFTDQGKTPQEWMALFPKMADPGTGNFDVEDIIKTGIASGVEHFYLERDLTPTPESTLTNAINYFTSLP